MLTRCRAEWLLLPTLMRRCALGELIGSCRIFVKITSATIEVGSAGEGRENVRSAATKCQFASTSAANVTFWPAADVGTIGYSQSLPCYPVLSLGNYELHRVFRNVGYCLCFEGWVVGHNVFCIPHTGRVSLPWLNNLSNPSDKINCAESFSGTFRSDPLLPSQVHKMALARCTPFHRLIFTNNISTMVWDL